MFQCFSVIECNQLFDDDDDDDIHVASFLLLFT